jgi:hypothetical protein
VVLVHQDKATVVAVKMEIMVVEAVVALTLLVVVPLE